MCLLIKAHAEGSCAHTAPSEVPAAWAGGGSTSDSPVRVDPAPSSYLPGHSLWSGCPHSPGRPSGEAWYWGQTPHARYQQSLEQLFPSADRTHRQLEWLTQGHCTAVLTCLAGPRKGTENMPPEREEQALCVR